MTVKKAVKKNPFSFSAEGISRKSVNTALRVEDNKNRPQIDTQTRSDVNKSGKKMFRQKGTGRARQGDGSAPHLVGGATKGPNLRKYNIKITKKQRNAAFRCVFCDYFESNKVIFVKDLPEFKEISTQRMEKWLIKTTGSKQRSLIIDENFSENFKKSARNIWYLDCLPFCGLNIRSILKASKILITEKALEMINGRFGGQK
jgi:large subunit ribosomal protein L4